MVFEVFFVFLFLHGLVFIELGSFLQLLFCCCTLWVPAQCGGCEVTGREGLSGSPGVPKECRQIGGKDGRGSRKELEGLWVRHLVKPGMENRKDNKGHLPESQPSVATGDP